MSCCLSVYFLVVFKTVLRGLWTFGFVGHKIVFWVLFVELGALLTLSITRLFVGFKLFSNTLYYHTVFSTYRLVETLFTSSSLRVKVTCPNPSVLPSPSILGLSTSGYTAVLRITRNFLIFGSLKCIVTTRF